jgi:hypothetical protein
MISFTNGREWIAAKNGLSVDESNGSHMDKMGAVISQPLLDHVFTGDNPTQDEIL